MKMRKTGSSYNFGVFKAPETACQSEFSLISSLSTDSEKTIHHLKLRECFFFGDIKTKICPVESALA